MPVATCGTAYDRIRQAVVNNLVGASGWWEGLSDQNYEPMSNSQITLALLCALASCTASAQLATTVTQGEESDLAATYSSTDLIEGLIATELPGDQGWHSVNTDPLDHLPAFTDGIGMRDTGLTGLLNDFPAAGEPAKLIRYALPAPADIDEIRVFTGNNARDGRVFHTYTVRFSSDWAQTFTAPIYVQSHPSGTLNTAANNSWRVVLSQLTNTAGKLAREVTHIDFNFYSVDNTGGEMRDPFDGVNPFTGTDDNLNAAFVSPLVWEIDVLGTDSPPRLQARRSGTELQLAWISRATNVAVQAATRLVSPDWADLSPQPAILRDGTANTTSIVGGSAPRYLRLSVVP
jgi:hypothetical protein